MSKDTAKEVRQIVGIANPERTMALMEHLIQAFEAYVSEHETPFVDAAMGVHNFHKAIIIDLTERIELPSFDHLRLFLQTWTDTFAFAMDQEYSKAVRKRSH